LKKNKRYIYLISPIKIKDKDFLVDLEKIFKTKKIAFFQLRLKKETPKKIIALGKKIRKLCRKYAVKLIINDFPKLTKIIDADGCHIGQSDMSLIDARKMLKNKIIGVTCHNSKRLIKKASAEGADYIAIGAFYQSITKKVRYKAKIKLLNEAKSITKIPIVAIGGIKFSNYKKLLLNNAHFLAISSYIWENKKLNPIEALRKLK
tara:strand:+ start:825 stop:1439 length:615 start_codon:yes stop_codon:yes gene_type:complete